MENEHDSEEIELLPFIHQVGGHSFMLSLDEATVCKALIPREVQFYQTLPPNIRKFTPNFYGVVRVRTAIDRDDYVRFYARSLSNYSVRHPAKNRVRFKKNGSIELLTNDGLFLEDSASQTSTGINPWVLTCHQQYMNRWKQPHVTSYVVQEEEQDFIVLENLVWRFSCPCVLDLKMGTRQYGDAASLAKKQSKMVKVVSTTSAKLGLRVGGMQVYQTLTARFLCRNKFYGRSLSVSGFQQALVQFLHNGVRLRSDVISVLVRKLEELATIVNKLDAIRFYTTSLLLLYEGMDYSDDEDIGQKMHLDNSDLGSSGRRGSDGDLGKKTESEYNANTSEDSPVLQSKRRTSSAANLEVTTPTTGTSSNSSSSSTIFEDTGSKLKGRSDSFRGRSFSTKSDPGGGSYLAEPRVDVRIIDFAHSTLKELDDMVVYSGPDRGFLFGLETLISMLKSIEIDYG